MMISETFIGGLIRRCGSNISRIRTESVATIKENAHNLAQENGVNDFLLFGNLEKAVKEIVDQPLPLVDGIEDQLVEFSEAMRCPTFAENSGNFEQKVGGSGSMKHLPIELESGEKSQRCCGENGICSHISLKWETPPQTVLILTKSNSTSVKILCAEMLSWLKEKRRMTIFVEPRV